MLTLVNNAQDRLRIPRSTTVISSTDPTVRELLVLANKEGRELASRNPWQAMTKEHTFTSVALEDQATAAEGSIPSELDRFINESFFNRTRKRRVTGPLTVEEWQTQKSIVASALTDSFRIRGDAFLLNPIPAAGDTYAYEYVSDQWC